MTIFDKTLQLSDAQAVTATANSTEIIDLGATGTVHGAAAPLQHNIGPGYCVPVLVQVVEAFATLTSLEVQLQASDAADFSTGVTSVTVMNDVAANLIAGKKAHYDVIPNDMPGRYIRARYIVTGTDATAGKITCGVVASVERN